MSVLMVVVMIAFGVFCGVNAIQLFYGQIKMRQAAKRGKGWHITDGHVVDATLKHIGYRSGWKPMITYTYRVHGVEHQGQRVSFDYFDTHPLSEANEIMERYAVGKTIQVFYDPERPQESALEPIQHETGNILILPLLLLLPTALCICAGLFGLTDILK